MTVFVTCTRRGIGYSSSWMLFYSPRIVSILLSFQAFEELERLLEKKNVCIAGCDDILLNIQLRDDIFWFSLKISKCHG